MSTWLGKNGNINDPGQYLGTGIDTSIIAKFPPDIAAFLFNTIAPMAGDDLFFGGRYQGFTGGPTPKPVISDSNQPGQITKPYLALPFTMSKPPAAPADYFLVVPASYTVSGSGTFDSITASPDIGQTVTFTGALTLAPYTSNGGGTLLALGGTSKFTGPLTVDGNASVAGTLEITGTADIEGMSSGTPSQQSLTANGTVKVDSGASLTTAGIFIRTTNTTTKPQLIVNGTLTDTDTTNGIMIGAGASEMGLLMATGAKITSMVATIGGMGGSGKATLDAASTWKNAGTFTLGEGGTLTDAGEIDANQFNLDGTTKLNGGTLKIVTQNSDNGPGAVTLQTDAMLTATAGSEIDTPLLQTETGSTATLTGTTLTDFGTDNLAVGAGATINGTVNFIAGIVNFSHSGSAFTVGYADPSGGTTGTVTTNGTSVTVATTTLGGTSALAAPGQATQGKLTITGGTWTDNGAGTSMTVGSGGVGILQLTGGAALNDQNVSIGAPTPAGTGQAASTAYVGGQSTWTINGTLSVGGQGVGQLTIAGGGFVSATGDVVADAGSTTAISSISVAGGMLKTGGALTLGGNGRGLLKVSGSSSVVTAGELTDMQGEIDVTGTQASVNTLGLNVMASSSGGKPNLVEIDAGGAITTGTLGAGVSSGSFVILGGGNLYGESTTIGGELSGYGTLGSNDEDTAATVTVNGTLVATGGTLTVAAAVTATGTLTINRSATLVIQQGLQGGTASFAGSGGTLIDEVGSPSTTTIQGFAAGDTIDLGSIQATQYQYLNGSLILENADGAAQTVLTLSGNYASTNFKIGTYSSGGTSITIGSGSPPAPPAITAPTPMPGTHGGETLDTAQALSVSPVQDPDATSTTQVTAHLGTQSTDLAADDSGGASVQGSGTESLFITGTLDEVNAALATLTATPILPGTDTLTLDVSDDLGNSDSAPPATLTTNDPGPSVTVPSSQSLTAGTPTPVDGVSVASVLTDPNQTYTVTLDDTAGLLAVQAIGGDQVSGSGTTAVTISGLLSSINQSLGTVTDTAPAAGTDTIDVTASDAFGGSNSQSIAVAVAAAPAITETDWAQPVDGAAGNAANWTAGVPNAGVTAVATPGNYTISGGFTAGQVITEGTTTFTGTVSATGLPDNYQTFLAVSGGNAIFDGGTLDTATVVLGGTDDDSGALTLQDGASALLAGNGPLGAAESIYLGLNSGGVGTLAVDASTLTAGTGLAVGDDGQGAVTVTDGGIVSTGAGGGTYADVELGNDTTGVGSVDVEDSGSEFTTSAPIFVGVAGLGSVDVSSGGTVVSDGASGAVAILGFSSGGTGFGSVDGAGSLWDVGQSLVVGYDGTGLVSITDGGKLEVDGALLRIGRDSGASGEVTLYGSGSTLDAPNAEVSIGLDGSGDLSLGSGTTATAGSIVIGGNADNPSATFEVMSAAEVTVSGAISFGASSSAGVTISGGTVTTSGGFEIGGSASDAVLAEDGAVINGGIQLGSGGQLEFDNTTSLNGAITLSGGVLLEQSANPSSAEVLSSPISVVSGTQSEIQGATPLQLDGSVTFDPAGGASVLIDGSVAIDGPVMGFAPGDILDLNNFAQATSLPDTAIWNDGVLGLYAEQYGGGAEIESFALPGNYALDQFMVMPDNGSGGVDVTVEPACYAAGTRIMTALGEVTVESLAMGDLVVTGSGQLRPVKWIGRRSYAGRFLAANPGVQPVRFCAGSLGDGLPRRDLLVSPSHAMFIDGLLVPARALINGRNVSIAAGLRRVDYYHVEFDTHDVLLAEGAPSESFLDDDSRGVFHNAAEYVVAYPDAPASGGFCARRVDSGHELEAIRQRLDTVAAGAMAVAA